MRFLIYLLKFQKDTCQVNLLNPILINIKIQPKVPAGYNIGTCLETMKNKSQLIPDMATPSLKSYCFCLGGGAILAPTRVE